MTDADPDAFTLVGAGHRTHRPAAPRPTLRQRLRGKPILAAVTLAAIVLCCLFAESVTGRDPGRFHLDSRNRPPGAEFYFGTDSLGRDIHSALWHGGRTSLLIGVLSAAVMSAIAIAYGCASGTASGPVDAAMMRAAELAQSVPALLTALFAVSLTGWRDAVGLAIIIGATSWFGLARLVRSEVRQIRNSEYILAAKCMGAGRLHVMRRHLVPNFLSAILFAVVSGVGTGMAMESTLSFLGLGLPIDAPSWGSMLSLADRALLLNTWWVAVIPGLFLVVTLLCVNSVGNYFRKENNKRPSNI